jgi:anaerobic magnesium-protoporphyrin IX monomethyl ester cyclase
MNVLLVYPNVMGVHKIPLGLSYISSCLIKAGHKVKLIDTSFGINDKIVLEQSKDIDLIGVSVMTLQLNQAKQISQQLKSYSGKPIIWGGNHVTMRPEECLQFDYVDMVCIGEGEYAMVDLADSKGEKNVIKNIKNIWLKINNEIIKNPLRSKINDLDELPFPDRDLFDPRHLAVNNGSIISASRECSFGCGYCINDKLIKLYKGNKFHSHRSIESMLSECKLLKEKYNVKLIEFSDETFTRNKEWVKEFCFRYKKEINLPFIFQTRCDEVDYEILKMVKDSGCSEISFGIESGNEDFRKNILGRKMSDKIIKEAFEMSKKIGYKVNSFNMVGLPFETEELIKDTIILNKKVKPHGHNVCIFYPFPGTKLGDLCEEKKWIIKDKFDINSYYFDTVLRMPQLSRNSILTYQKFFPILLKTNPLLWKLFIPLFKVIIYIFDFIQKKVQIAFLKKVFNNLYWLNYALTSCTIQKKIFHVVFSKRS